MSEIAKKNNMVVSQLHNMLTNHPERMHSVLNIWLTSSKDDSLIAKDEFEIYTNHPENKIKEKVEKLKLKGGISNLKIEQLTKVAGNEYILALTV